MMKGVDMEPVNQLAYVAGLIADPTRSKIILSLFSGKALTAGELSKASNLTPQTVSAHLKKLEEGKIITRLKQGRHHYFTLSGNQIVELVEKLLGFSASAQEQVIKTGPQNEAMRTSRVCYDHLAGYVGVKLFDKMLEYNFINHKDGAVVLTAKGEDFFNQFGLNVMVLKKAKRPTCLTCLDWSERRFHLSGGLGAALLDKFLNDHWVYRKVNSRVIIFNPEGKRKMYEIFGINS